MLLGSTWYKVLERKKEGGAVNLIQDMQGAQDLLFALSG